MKQLAILLVTALLSAGVLVGCDDETDDDATEEVVEQDDEQLDDDGHVVDDIVDADDEEVIDDEEHVELEGAQWLESELYDVKIQVPDDWELGSTNDVVSANAPDGSTTAIIGGSESDETLQAAIDDLKDDLEMTDVELEESDPTSLNGFPGHRGRGSGVIVNEDDIDEEVQFIGYALRVGDDKNVTLMIFSEATMYEAQRDIIDGIAHTISRI